MILTKTMMLQRKQYKNEKNFVWNTSNETLQYEIF